MEFWYILNKQGYWLYSNDFKNIEITNIQNVGSRKKRQAISIVTRSILHDNKGEEEIKEYPDALLWRFKISQ